MIVGQVALSVLVSNPLFEELPLVLSLELVGLLALFLDSGTWMVGLGLLGV